MAQPAIRFVDVGKTYPSGVRAVHDLSLAVGQGEFVAVVGRSGAGKSTLLRLINRLVEPCSGEIWVCGRNVTAANSTELRRIRTEIGFIFQEFHLVERSTVLTNVLTGRLGKLPAWRGTVGWYRRSDVDKAWWALERLGIADKADQRADTLSGGQRQRTAIARALAQEARIILADEPVASVDPTTAHSVMRDLKRLNRQDGIPLMVSLHAIELAREYADRIVGLRESRVVFDGPAAMLNEEVLTLIYDSQPDSAGGQPMEPLPLSTDTLRGSD